MMFNRSGNFPIKNKYWELEISNIYEWSYFNFQIKWTRKCDHAGFSILIEIYKFFFDFKIYDIRHWNYEKDRYEGDED